MQGNDGTGHAEDDFGRACLSVFDHHRGEAGSFADSRGRSCRQHEGPNQPAYISSKVNEFSDLEMREESLRSSRVVLGVFIDPVHTVETELSLPQRFMAQRRYFKSLGLNEPPKVSVKWLERGSTTGVAPVILG